MPFGMRLSEVGLRVVVVVIQDPALRGGMGLIPDDPFKYRSDILQDTPKKLPQEGMKNAHRIRNAYLRA